MVRSIHHTIDKTIIQLVVCPFDSRGMEWNDLTTDEVPIPFPPRNHDAHFDPRKYKDYKADFVLSHRLHLDANVTPFA